MAIKIILGIAGLVLSFVCLYAALKVYMTTYREASKKERERIWGQAEQWVSEKSGLGVHRYNAKRIVAEYIANKGRLTMGLFNG